jgi:hypothetical protein
MYYEERRTQLEIATNLNVAQGTVCRFLKRAEERGIVRTTVSAPVGTFLDLEELLEQKFGIAQVIIARALNRSEESTQDAVGAAAAHFLGTTLRPGAVIGVFVDGSTMKIKIVESNSQPLLEGARIRQISEDQAKLVIECEDSSTIDVNLANPGKKRRWLFAIKPTRSNIWDRVPGRAGGYEAKMSGDTEQKKL